MKDFIKAHYIILHTLLIPVFFIVHNCFDFYSLIDIEELKQEIVLWLLLPFIFTSLFYLLFRNLFKASLLSSLLLILIFFGPSFMAFAGKIQLLFYFSKLSFFYACTIILLVFVLIKMRRSKNNYLSLHRFLFVCFLILLIYEPIYWFAGGRQKIVRKNRVTLSEIPELKNTITVSDSLPDIYFLVFDELATSDTYRQLLNYDNIQKDSLLQSMGFKVMQHSFAASFFTHAAIPTVLNMCYLPYKEQQQITFGDMHALMRSVNQNVLVSFLIANGYKIYNGSIFSLQNIPGLTKPQLWGLHPASDLITNQTLPLNTWNRLGWMIKSKIPGTISAGDRLVSDTALINEAYSIVQNTIADTTQKRKFLYAHFLLPHAPVRYDSTGQVLHWTNANEYNEKNKSNNLYKGQVKYTFDLIIKLCSQILEQSKRPTVIILQGDHGLRDFDTSRFNQSLKLQPYTAFYFFDRNYSSLPDTFYTPNTFRIVMNQYFNQQLPMLKRKLYYLRRENEASLFRH